MRLKIRENLGTASLNSKFTGFMYKKKCIWNAPGFTGFRIRATIVLLNEWV